jgi:hypothetical protein
MGSKKPVQVSIRATLAMPLDSTETDALDAMFERFLTPGDYPAEVTVRTFSGPDDPSLPVDWADRAIVVSDDRRPRRE